MYITSRNPDHCYVFLQTVKDKYGNDEKLFGISRSYGLTYDIRYIHHVEDLHKVYGADNVETVILKNALSKYDYYHYRSELVDVTFSLIKSKDTSRVPVKNCDWVWLPEVSLKSMVSRHSCLKMTETTRTILEQFFIASEGRAVLQEPFYYDCIFTVLPAPCKKRPFELIDEDSTEIPKGKKQRIEMT